MLGIMSQLFQGQPLYLACQKPPPAWLLSCLPAVPAARCRQMEKTEKTIAEMEIQTNLALEFDKITEAGAKLQPVHGPG